MTKELLGSLELNRIYQMDCLEGMRLIPDDSVNLIVIDPPYNIGKDKRWDKWRTVSAYVEFMGEVFKECERVLKVNGSFYFFHNDFLQIVELQNWINHNTKFQFNQLIIWDKFNGGSPGDFGRTDSYANQRNYPKHAEYCLFYTFEDETGLKSIYPEMMKEFQRYFSDVIDKSEYKKIAIELGTTDTAVRHWVNYPKQPSLPSKENYEKLQKMYQFSKTYSELKKEYEDTKEKFKEKIKEIEDSRYTFNNQKLPSVWQHVPMKQNGHITPKPVSLIERIINTSSNPGDIVLDCFMGSGTTAVAASRLNRNFIGFEREPEYIQICNQRLEALSDTESERKLTE